MKIVSRFLKILYWSLGLFFAAVMGAFLTLAFSPGLQRALVLQALHPLTKQCRLDYIKIGWNRIELKEFYALAEKGALGIKSLDLRAPFFALAFGDKLEINRLVAEGVALDLTPIASLSPSKAAAGAVVTAAASDKSASHKKHSSTQIHLKPLKIGELKLEGELYFPEDKTLAFDMSAKDLAVGTEGTFLMNGKLTHKGNETGRVQSMGSITQSIVEGKPELGVSLTTTGWGQTGIEDMGVPFSSMGLDLRTKIILQPQRVALDALSLRVMTGEHKELVDLSLLQPLTVPLDGDLAMLTQLAGPVMSFTTQKLPLSLFSVFMPGYTLAGELQPFTFSIAAHEGQFSGKMDEPLAVRAVTLHQGATALVEGWGGGCNVAFSAVPRAERRGQLSLESLTLNTLTASIQDAQGKALFRTELMRALPVPLDGRLESLLAGEGDLLSLDVIDLPLALANPFIVGHTLGGSVGGLKGKISLTDGNVRWASIDPLQLRAISLREGDKVLLEGVSGWIRPTFDGTFEAFKAGVEELNLRTGEGASWAMGAVEGKGLLDKKGRLGEFDVSGRLTAMLPGLLGQPMFKDYNALQAGNLIFTIGVQGERAGKIVVQASADLKNIALNPKALPTGVKPGQGPQSLSATFQGEANGGALDGKLTFLCQGALDKTDVILSGSTKENRYDFDIKGKQVNLDDMLALAAIFDAASNSGVEGSKGASSHLVEDKSEKKPTRDVRAFWADGPEVSLKCALDTITQGGQAIGRSVLGRFRVDSKTVALDSLTGTAFEAPFNVMGTLAFNEGAKVPYTLTGSATLKGLNMAKCLAVQKPGSQSPIEGRLDAEAKLAGKGYQKADLFKRLQGDMAVTGKQGKLYMLEAAGGTAQVGAIALGVAGALLGKKTPPSLQTANDLTSLLRVVEYDNLMLKAERGDDLNIRLTNCLVQGPTLRLSGTGQITYKEKVSVADQPLSIKANLDSAGQAAQLMNRLRLLQGDKKDTAGYSMGPVFNIGGSLTKPDFSELYGLIAKAGSSLVVSPSEDAAPADTTLSPEKLLKGLFKR